MPNVTVIAHIAAGEVSPTYHVVGEGVRLFVVDDNHPGDRVFKWLSRSPESVIGEVIPEGSSIGSNQGQRHATVQNSIEAAVIGRPHFAVVPSPTAEDKGREDRARDSTDRRVPSAGLDTGLRGIPAGAKTLSPDSRAYCVVNLGSAMAMLHTKDIAREDLPYFLAESMMQEIVQVIEQWAGAEFSEERIEALLAKYAAYAAAEAPTFALSREEADRG